MFAYTRLYRPENLCSTWLCFVYGRHRIFTANVVQVRVVVNSRFSLDFSALTAPGQVCRIAVFGRARSCYVRLHSGIRLRPDQSRNDSVRSIFCRNAWQLLVPGQVEWHNCGPSNLHGKKARTSRKLSATKNKTTGAANGISVGAPARINMVNQSTPACTEISGPTHQKKHWNLPNIRLMNTSGGPSRRTHRVQCYGTILMAAPKNQMSKN